jgi:hypothetical protein
VGRIQPALHAQVSRRVQAWAAQAQVDRLPAQADRQDAQVRLLVVRASLLSHGKKKVR